MIQTSTALWMTQFVVGPAASIMGVLIFSSCRSDSLWTVYCAVLFLLQGQSHVLLEEGDNDCDSKGF